MKNAALLASLGAQPGPPVRMAGRGDPRRHHAEALHFEETGAIVAALTTSIPEAPNTQRNWDYRYCWLRDAYFVVQRSIGLGATAHHGGLPPLHHQYRRRIRDAAASAAGLRHPARSRARRNAIAADLAGYRGMGPVRVGNQAYDQIQNDVYGSVMLAAPRSFSTAAEPPARPRTCSRSSSAIGEQAGQLRPARRRPVGIARHRARAHLLGHHVLGRVRPPGQDRRPARAAPTAPRTGASMPSNCTQTICERAWNEKRGLLRLHLRRRRARRQPAADGRTGFLTADDPRFRAPSPRSNKHLKRGDFLFRYDDADDFGHAGDRVHRLHLLVHRCAGRAGPARRSARAVREVLARRNHARPAVGRRRHRRPANCGAISRRPTPWSA